MMQRSRSLFRASACVAALVAGPVLTGCSGVVKNLNSAQVNTPSLNVSNPFGADNQLAAVLVSSSAASNALTAHAVLKAHVTAPNVSVFQFTRQSAGGLSSTIAQSASVAFNVNPTVTVDGGTLPATFTLSTINITAEADDLSAPGGSVTDSIVLPPLTSSIPVVFTQSAAGSSTYNAAGGVKVATSTINGATLTSLFNIVTGENANKQAILTLTATSPDLPAGSLIHITLGSSTLNVKASTN